MPIDRTQRYLIPQRIFERDGPFSEFKQDGAFVTVELTDGRRFDGILVIYPNQIAAMEGHSKLPFDPAEIVRVVQTPSDLERRSSSDWHYWEYE